jgi:protocatechuate 3,4-dioxygenase beta subunit
MIMDNDDRQIGKILSRRELLVGLGTVGTAIVLGCSWQKANFASNIISLPPCVVRPELTEGPYFVDEKINRSDIRSDPSDGSIKAGTPLEIEFLVSQIGKNSCQPLPEVTVDVWHCDALGVYSDVGDRSFDTTGQKFLRGFQTTDKNGIAKFTTIFPGWYQGRTVHIHFKIRGNSSGKNYEFTSQLFFNDEITDKIHSQNPYSEKGQRTLKNDRDGIFNEGGNQLLLSLTPSNQGYKAKFEIGLQIA